MDALSTGIFLPHAVIYIDVDPFHAVKSHDVKIPHGLVVLRRISGCDNEKSIRHTVCPEGFVLQELQHCRRERLRDAVDLVEKENTLLNAAPLDLIVNRSDDLAHGILRDRIFLPAIIPPTDIWQTNRALSRVVRDRIGDQIDMGLLRHLLHDGRLPDGMAYSPVSSRVRYASIVFRISCFACPIFI